MKRNSLLLISILLSINSFAQEAVVVSANSVFNNINIRANTTSVPVIKFTRYPGMTNHQHNAFVGQFHNTTLNEYSFGIGTGFSTNSDQDFNNHVITATLSGRVGIHTLKPRAFLDMGLNISSGQLGTVFGRLSEGDQSGDGTFLGVRGFNTQPINVKSFALEHSFYGQVNSSINFYRGVGMTGGFISFSTDNNVEKLRISAEGNVGIGTINPTQKLTVNGTVYSTEVKVDVNAGTGPDYVFEPTYQLPSLTEIENYIKANKHLPDVPSAKEMEANGINLSEMNMLLLKKVEELTLYVISIKSEVDSLRQENEELKKSVSLSINKK